MPRAPHYRVARPKWWPVQENRAEALTIPTTWLTGLALVGMVAGALLFLGVSLPSGVATPSVVHAWQGAIAVPPAGVLLQGAIEGSLTGLTAIALILVYRTNRIINFAQTALGGAAGVVTFVLVIAYDVPFVVAVPLALLMAVGTGTVAELLLRRFVKAPRLVVTIATIAMAPALTRIMNQVVVALTPAPAPGEVSALRTIPPLVPSFHLAIAGQTFSFAQVTTVVGSIAVLAALALFLQRSRTGQAVRAAAENSEGAWLLGINIRLLGTLVWALAAVLAALAAIFQLAMHGVASNDQDGGAVSLFPAIVAAVVAGMEVMPVAMFFAIWSSMVDQGLRWAFPGSDYYNLGLLAAMLIALVVQRGRLERRESRQGSAWEAAKDVKATPKQLRSVPAVRNGRVALLLLGAAVVAIFPFVASASQLTGGTVICIEVIVCLSLLVTAGWAGQISLGQYALVAVGAVVGSGLMAKGLSFWLALPVATAAAAAMGVGLGLVALRLRGLYLAAVTLGFAIVVPTTLFDPHYFGWLLPAHEIDRPGVLGVSLDDDRAYYYLVLAVALAFVYVLSRLRRTRPGRALIALRDNEAAAQSVGIPAMRSRIAALALSGGMAGTAGVLLVVLELSLQVKDFGPEQSVNVFLFLVLGGLGSVSGAVLGGIVGGSLAVLVPSLAGLLTGVGAFFIMVVLPGGLAQGVYATRDAILRVIALRLRIAVPSLFADYDAEAQRRRLMPLARPVNGIGLAALPVTRRYALRSWLWNPERGA